MMTDEELDEKLESLTEKDIDNLEGDELLEMVERVYGPQEEDEEEEPRPGLQIELREGDDKDEVLARTALKPELKSAATMLDVGGLNFANTDININALLEALEKQTAAVRSGDLSTADAMLSAQANTLDLLFNKLIRASSANSGVYFDAAVGYMKLAMKAQSQCRTTWEAIAKIKNPPIANYVKQLNAAQNQQINNENPPSKLKEKSDDKRLVAGTQGDDVGINSNVATLDTLNRPKVARG